MLKTGEAAEYLGITNETLRSWVARGIIRCTKTPTGQLRFREEDVREVAEGMGCRPDVQGGELLTPGDAAEMLGISTTCILDWSRRGILPLAVRTPTRRRFLTCFQGWMRWMEAQGSMAGHSVRVSAESQDGWDGGIKPHGGITRKPHAWRKSPYSPTIFAEPLDKTRAKSDKL